MTVEEIFSQLSQHMIQGLMFHLQLSEYFGFLGLCGYQKYQEYQYISESKCHSELIKYYLEYYNKLIPSSVVANPNIIPESWLKYTRQDVNASTRKTAIQTGFEKWIVWEKETKTLYEKLYKELYSLGEISATIELKKYIKEVSCELAKAEKENLHLKAIDYNISDIINKQSEIYKKYNYMIK